MNWLTFIGPILKAKLAIIALIGQVYVVSLIYQSVDLHDERIRELLIVSAILWVSFIIFEIGHLITMKNQVYQMEVDFDKTLSAELDKYSKIIIELGGSPPK